MTKKYLLDSYKRYPVMHTEDFILQMHQAEFCSSRYSGGDVEYNMHEECLLFSGADGIKPVYDVISSELVRVNLRPYCERGYNLSTLADLFKWVKPMGTNEGMDRRIDEFMKLVESGRIDLPNDDVKGKIERYKQGGYMPIPHSKAFKLNYNPHYRVIFKKHAVVLPIIAKIEHMLYHKMNVIIAIDGNSCSGKSTYADILSEYYSFSNVITTDDFFVPKADRATNEDKQGTNIDYKRLREVLENVVKDQEFYYDRYDCETDSFEPVRFRPKRLTIVEGSYSLHEELRDLYAFSVVLKVSKREQISRVIAREGNSGASQYLNKWIPQEDSYLAKLDTSNCIIIDTTGISFDG